MRVIGLTGNICSGKSTVSKFLADLGAVVLSADKIGHEALAPHTETWREVVGTFGERILNMEGNVDRQKLGEIVYHNAEDLARLNRIMHPVMYRIAEKEIKELKKQGAEIIVLEAPLLVEAGWLPLVDQVWVTVANESTMLYRCCQRSGLSEDQVLARIRSQIPAEEKTKYADVVIDTDCSLSAVEVKVKGLWEVLHTEVVKEKIRQVLSRREKKTIKNEGLTSAAVLIPIYEKGGEYYLVVTRRTEEVNDHKGQISFPGGGWQKGDETLRDTALRESCEEIGLNPKDVEILGELDDIVTTTTNYIISPFVAAVPYPHEFRASPREVEEIIEVPISALLAENNYRERLEFRQGKPVFDYSYEYEGRVIWGATARILKRFLELVFGS